MTCIWHHREQYTSLNVQCTCLKEACFSPHTIVILKLGKNKENIGKESSDNPYSGGRMQ
jgi:hypothetical protein